MPAKKRPAKEATDTRTRKARAKAVTYSDELAGEICYRLANGKALKAICRLSRMPTFQSVLRWVNDNPAFAKSYAVACDMRAQCLADELLEIADTQVIGERIKTLADGGQETVRLDLVERSKLRVDARKWILARLAPKRFGDRITQELTGPDGQPIAVSGPPRPSPEEVREFAAELTRGFLEYRNEAGEAAEIADAAETLGYAVAQFASGEDHELPKDRKPEETGAFLARLQFINRKMRADNPGRATL